jgi:halocyanin-like protein
VFGVRREVTRRTTLRSLAGAGTTAAVGGATVAEPARAQSGYDGWFSDASEGGSTSNYAGTVDETGTDEVTVTVGADGNGGPYAFGPAAIRIDPGTTVTFRWISDNHNVVIQDSPEGTAWSGITDIYDTGHETSHTFETAGIYTYYCDPHLALGMKGAIVVGDADTGESADASAGDGDTGNGGDGPAGQELLPGNDFGRVFVGLMLGAGLFAAIGAFTPEVASSIRRLRRGTVVGGGGQAPVEDVSESPAYEPPEEIGHHDYDPTGTARLILGYFLILVVMWVIMYFIEFLGNGPTVVG